jgi:hypothetical protein
MTASLCITFRASEIQHRTGPNPTTDILNIFKFHFLQLIFCIQVQGIEWYNSPLIVMCVWVQYTINP